ncbi:MAG: hypothetical protein E7478_03460 [Ruminococcaceae bacterium]|nr:hypothetical protein [Oscillospiraceae bacterium]
MRDEIERVIKELRLDRSRVFEVSHLQYASIIRRIEQTFVKNGGSLHWSNIEMRFAPSLSVKTQYIGDHPMWISELERIIPDTLHYVLFEDNVDMRAKYWVYEMRPREMITVLSEVEMLHDFYIVSKKMKWLISECHEDIVYFVGDVIDISKLEQ